MNLDEYLKGISNAIFNQQSTDPYFRSLEDLVKYVLTAHLVKASSGTNADPLVAAATRSCLDNIKTNFLQDESGLSSYLKFVIEKGLNDPTSVKVPELNDLPPGSPIGCGF